MKSEYFLQVRYGTSKGRDTYGYTTCSLRDAFTGKKLASCNGGGYCMTGTVFAEWMEREFQEQLKAVEWDESQYYGVNVLASGKVLLDGACGDTCMFRILEALGYQVECTSYLRKGDLKTYKISKVES